jgi:hypothetical protein
MRSDMGIFDRSTVAARCPLFIGFLPNCCTTATDVLGPIVEWEIVDTTVLIRGVLSKIRPRNCPNQSYVHRITDSGPAPGVGG